MIIGVDIRALATGRRSGIEEYILQLLEHMIPLDASISYTLYFSGHAAVVPEMNILSRQNVRLHRDRTSNRWAHIRQRLGYGPFLDRVVGGADAFFFPHIIGGSTSPGVRRILTVHDLSFELFPEFFSPRQRLWHWLQSPRAIARAADAIIAVSASTHGDLANIYGISPNRISVIPSGVGASLVRASVEQQTAVRAAYRLPDRFILCMGTIEPRKNLESVLAAYEDARARNALSRIGLVLAGPDGWRSADVRTAIRRSPFADDIMMLGAIADSDRAALYSAAELCLYPSFLEGFGFPPLEAMACGTPIVATSVSSVPEVVGDAGVLVPPTRPGYIADACVAILGDARFSAMLAERGRARAARFSWQTAAEQTLGVITGSSRLVHTRTAER